MMIDATLKKRVLTAAIGLPITLLIIIFSTPALFALLMAGLMLLGAWEWSQLASIHKKSHRIFYTAAVFLGLVVAVFIPTQLFLWITLACWVWLFAAIVQYEKKENTLGFHFSWIRKIIGFFILIAMWESIVMLKANPNFGPAWVIAFLLIVFAADTGGYFAGRFYGKRLLSSRVSPKKTWEGLAGGMGLSLVVGLIVGVFLTTTVMGYFSFLLLCIVTALFSVVGDLGVSLQKRLVNIKDTGSFFPGHGGLLDRLDSIACASVVFLLGALLLRL